MPRLTSDPQKLAEQAARWRETQHAAAIRYAERQRETGRKPLPRMVRVKAVNPKRKARLRVIQFGDAYVAWLHTQPCVCCGRWERERMHAHHVVSRARGGTERDLVSLHAECHERGHTGGWQTFQKKRGVDLRLEADRLWLRWAAFAMAPKSRVDP